MNNVILVILTLFFSQTSPSKNRTGKGKPVCVLLHTEMGNGVDFMMYSHAWHGKAPNDTQLETALAQNYNTGGESDY